MSIERRFNHGTHAAAAGFNAPITAVCMDLVAFELGPLFGRGIDDCLTGGVHFDGLAIGIDPRQAKELLKQLDHIVISVIVVVQHDDVVAGLFARLAIPRVVSPFTLLSECCHWSNLS